MLVSNLIDDKWQHDYYHGVDQHLEVSKYQQNQHHIVEHFAILELITVVIFGKEDHVTVNKPGKDETINYNKTHDRVSISKFKMISNNIDSH